MYFEKLNLSFREKKFLNLFETLHLLQENFITIQDII